MSTTEYDADEEAVSDREKARCRRNRRPSVQFIDKNLIRRRSSGLEKQYSLGQQQPRLPSISANDESEPTDVDQYKPTLPPQKEYCETSLEDSNFLRKKKSFNLIFFSEANI
jgi:hypothetical protein